MWKVSMRPIGGDEFGDLTMEVIGTFNSLYDVAQLFGVTFAFIANKLEESDKDFCILFNNESETIYHIEGI
jgi:hypothetical protein